MIPVRFRGEKGIYVHSMYLDVEAPISGGREIWGFLWFLFQFFGFPARRRTRRHIVNKGTRQSPIFSL
jgi:acetoacetate decarboxylase